MNAADNWSLYLGDGVYAAFDGYHVVLTTGADVSRNPDNTVYLDAQVLAAFDAYRLRLSKLPSRMCNCRGNVMGADVCPCCGGARPR